METPTAYPWKLAQADRSSQSTSFDMLRMSGSEGWDRPLNAGEPSLGSPSAEGPERRTGRHLEGMRCP